MNIDARGGIPEIPNDNTLPPFTNALNLASCPHLWPENVEIDLRDGSFGRRYTGNITVPLNQQDDRSVNYSGNMIDSGGWITLYEVSGIKQQLGHILTNNDGVVLSYSSINKSNTGIGTLRTLSGWPRTNAPYDVWIRYVK
jgi:hypothetical protein